MDAFEAKHWSRLQILLWICVRDKEAVRWSAHQPWMPGLAELDGYDGPYFESEEELIGLAIINLGSVMSFFEAERDLIKTLADGELRLYRDPSGRQFSDSAAVLKIWKESATSAKGGRPPLSCKPIVVERALAWLDEEGGDQPKAKIVRFMGDACAELDVQPGETTLKNWAGEALDEFKRRCATGERKP